MATTFARLAIYVFSFLGIFALLFGAIDARFFIVSYSASAGYDPEIAEQFSIANITLYGNAGNDNITYPYSSYWDNGKTWSAGLPPNQYLEVWWDNLFRVGKTIQFRHIEEFWWGLGNPDNCVFTLNDKENLLASDLEDHYDESINGTSTYGSCSHITASVIFAYNQTKYTSITDSWKGNELYYTLSYEVDWNATQISALNILGQLLTFQSPDLGVSGSGGLILNGLIAIPFIIMIIVLIILLVQSVIPFIKGL